MITNRHSYASSPSLMAHSETRTKIRVRTCPPVLIGQGVFPARHAGIPPTQPRTARNAREIPLQTLRLWTRNIIHSWPTSAHQVRRHRREGAAADLPWRTEQMLLRAARMVQNQSRRGSCLMRLPRGLPLRHQRTRRICSRLTVHPTDKIKVIFADIHSISTGDRISKPRTRNTSQQLDICRRMHEGASPLRTGPITLRTTHRCLPGMEWVRYISLVPQGIIGKLTEQWHRRMQLIALRTL